MALGLLAAALAACVQQVAVPEALPSPAPTETPMVVAIAPTGTLPPPSETPTPAPPTETPTPAPPTPTWTPPPPTDVPTWPSARMCPGLAYDISSERVVLFGGVDKSLSTWDNYATDMWALDTVAKQWTLLKGTTSVRYMNGAEAYDAESDRIIVQDWYSSYTMVLDADLESWEKKDYCPLNLVNGAAMAYDAESVRMILFGGYKSSGPSASDKTWAYDYNTDTWTEMKPEVVPPARSGPVMVYDDESDRVYMWGGWQSAGYTEVDPTTCDRQMWAYDYNNDTWTSLGDAGAPDVALADAAAAHHPGTGRMILFGGQKGNPWMLSDKTWAYSYRENAWTEVMSDQSPSARNEHSMVYDSVADKIVLFGGATEWVGGTQYATGADYSDELWFFDPKTNQWAQVTPSS